MMDTKSRFNSFYTRPSFVIKTSAEIISEARAAMEAKAREIASSRNPQAVRLVHTKRPFTPREPHRTLFGKNVSGRPPSAISIRQVKFQDLDSNLPQLQITPVNPQQRPVLPKSGRWRLPAIDTCKKNMRLTSSLDNLPEELETDSQDEVVQSSAQLQKPHSSPKERTMLSHHASDFLLPTPVGKTWIPSKYSNLSNETKFGDLKSKKHDVFRNEQYSPLKTKAFLENSFHSTSITEETGLEADDSEAKDTVKHKEQAKINFQEGTATDVKPQLSEVKKLFNKVERDTKPHTPKSSTKPAVEKLTETDVTHDNRINEARAVAIKPSNETIQTLSAELHRLAATDWKDNNVIPVMEKLYLALEQIMSSSSSSKHNKVKSQVLKAVYNFVESAGELLLLHIARVVLMLRVTGQNLSAICKLIFKISRSDKNDKLFQEDNILELFVEALGRASPLEDAEACIYGYGALKFLTMNNELLKSALKLGALELMVLHIKIVNNARMELISIPEQTSHALFQLTGALRNVASEEPAFLKFVNTGAVTELCRAMELFSADLDLISNMSRTLSILSTDDACCQNIVNYETSFRTFIKLLAKFPGRQDIIVRLGYVLGNLMAKCNPARLKLFNEPGAVSIIVSLLESYLEKDLEMSYNLQNPESNTNNSNVESGSDGSIEDVIIKMVRIIANMSMHPTVGMGLTYHLGNNNDQSTYSAEDHHPQEGARFLEVLLSILRRKSVNESEELILSTLSTLNNLSFYSDPEVVQDDPFAHRQIEIVQALSGLLILENEDCLIETTRVFGNLTRCKESRDYLLETGGICQLVRCLERDNKELLSTITGVLVNLMADWDKRLAFKEDNGIARLINVLGKYGESDWKLANLICQALWNFCIDSTHLYAAFGIQPTNQLVTILIDLLDEERLFGIPEGEDVDEVTANRPEYQQWEQFAEVATNLLEKIEKYLETLQAFGVEV